MEDLVSDIICDIVIYDARSSLQGMTNNVGLHWYW